MTHTSEKGNHSVKAWTTTRWDLSEGCSHVQTDMIASCRRCRLANAVRAKLAFLLPEHGFWILDEDANYVRLGVVGNAYLRSRTVARPSGRQDRASWVGDIASCRDACDRCQASTGTRLSRITRDRTAANPAHCRIDLYGIKTRLRRAGPGADAPSSPRPLSLARWQLRWLAGGMSSARSNLRESVSLILQPSPRMYATRPAMAAVRFCVETWCREPRGRPPVGIRAHRRWL
jgi:hypothetical protein